MRILRRPVVLLLPLLWFAASCGEFSELLAFQQSFRSHFELNSLNVSRSNDDLAITVGDRRFQTAAGAEREAVAREMAEYVRERYDGYPTLETVTIQFSHTRKLAVATMSSDRIHRFSAADLGAPGTAAEAAGEAAAD